MSRRNMFEVDVDGLRQLVAKRGKSFILFELYQNARDQDVARIAVTFERVGNAFAQDFWRWAAAEATGRGEEDPGDAAGWRVCPSGLPPGGLA